MFIIVFVYNIYFKSKKCSIIWCWIMFMYFCCKYNFFLIDIFNKLIKINFFVCIIGG